MAKVIWRVVNGYENYEISNTGLVRHNKNGVIRNVKVYYREEKNGYIKARVNIGKNFNLGRLVLITFNRHPLEGEECDHIDRDGRNNNIENLRWVYRKDNLLNRSNYGNSKYKGVSRCHTSYKRKDGSIVSYYQIRAQITINGNRINLGNFKTEEDAHEAYKVAFKKYYGYEWVD